MLTKYTVGCVANFIFLCVKVLKNTDKAHGNHNDSHFSTITDTFLCPSMTLYRAAIHMAGLRSTESHMSHQDMSNYINSSSRTLTHR